jgi:large subunit ribosomal protein L25
MTQELILMAEPRTVLGKKVGALRRQGLIPGVVYGPAMEGTIQVSVNRRELERFYQAHGHSALFTLKWDGGSQQVFIREVQVEPVRHTPLHVDFFAPNLNKALTAAVPVVLHHHSSRAEGILMQLLETVELRGLPNELPTQIDADVSKLVAVGDQLHASDLALPGSVELITPGDAPVASIVAQALREEAEELETEPTPPADDVPTTVEG